MRPAGEVVRGGAIKQESIPRPGSLFNLFLGRSALVINGYRLHWPVCVNSSITALAFGELFQGYHRLNSEDDSQSCDDIYRDAEVLRRSLSDRAECVGCLPIGIRGIPAALKTFIGKAHPAGCTFSDFRERNDQKPAN
jgi:hypothetical protein